MLSISSMQAAGYYLDLAREDYYLEGGEPPGKWHGKAAGFLGLAGTVERQQFEKLLYGFAPDGRKLVQNAGAESHQAGWDLTFSAPKSVSVLWAAAPPQLRKELQAAHDQAVRAALDYLEADAAFSRRGKGGALWEQAGFAAALFEHGTSRAQDPQLHTHCLVLNVATRQDGTTGSLLSKPLYQHKMAAGALYRAELAHVLSQTLGLALKATKNGFELTGVPKALEQEFSKRREAILEALKGRGRVTAEDAARAALTTRTSKEHLPRSELFDRWQEIASRNGLDPANAQSLRTGEPKVKEPGLSNDKLLQAMTRHDSHFPKRDLIRASATEAVVAGVDAAGVRRFIASESEQNGNLIKLGVRDRYERFTTKDLLETEARLLETARELAARPSPRVSEWALRQAVGKKPLNDEQLEAARHLTLGNSGVRLVSGMAGTGKTTLLATCREAWEHSGYEVVGAALAGKAAKGLNDHAGIESRTLASWLHGLDNKSDAPWFRLGPKTIFVLDEAGMVGTRLMERLVTHLKEKGATLVAVGDAKQLQPIEAGGVFHALTERHGHKELTTIVRQKEEWAREAVHQFAEGRAREALALYAERGQVAVTNTRDEALESLVTDWKKAALPNLQGTLIVAATNREVDSLNSRCQTERMLAAPYSSRALQSVKVGSESFFEGDRVLFEQNNRELGVYNGDLATIERVYERDRTLRVRLDGGETTVIALNDYEDLRLGYAATTHKAQGVTVDDAYILLGGNMQDRELSYVQASRTRRTTRFYVDQHEAGPDLDDVVASMSKSRRKDIAHDILQAPEEKLQDPTHVALPAAQTHDPQHERVRR